MRQILVSLAALIAAASMVTIANATMTTIIPLRMLEDGAREASVAIFGAAYFLGFAVGCFSEPPRILRVGYIRAFAASAAFCTALAVVIDLTAWPTLWIALRFFMGLSIAAIFASVDGWINATTPDRMRGTVYSTYGWCIGASAVLGQLLLVVWDGLAVGFVTLLALGFNAAVMLVTLTRASAPSTAPAPTPDADNPVRGGALVVTSTTAAVGAIYAGLVTTAILSILPAILAGKGVGERPIALVVAAFFVGRLIWQIPMGLIADRMDLRLLIAIIAALTGAVTLTGSLLVLSDAASAVAEASAASHLLFLAIMALLGGLILPLYTVANSLAFARAGELPAVKIATTLLLLFLAIMALLGGLILPLYTVANSLAFARAGELPAVKIATTLLLVNSAGAVAGPLLVAALLPSLGENALTTVIVVASGLTATYALWRRASTGGMEPASSGLAEAPTTSLAMTETFAGAREDDAAAERKFAS